MGELTKQSMLRYLNMREEYKRTRDRNLYNEIEKFRKDVICKDKDYYSKVKSYNFSKEQIRRAL